MCVSFVFKHPTVNHYRDIIVVASVDPNHVGTGHSAPGTRKTPGTTGSYAGLRVV